MNLFTPIELFNTRLTGLNAPYSDSVVLDPDILAQYTQDLHSRKYEKSYSKYDFPEFVVHRNRTKTTRILYYRKEATRT